MLTAEELRAIMPTSEMRDKMFEKLGALMLEAAQDDKYEITVDITEHEYNILTDYVRKEMQESGCSFSPKIHWVNKQVGNTYHWCISWKEGQIVY